MNHKKVDWRGQQHTKVGEDYINYARNIVESMGNAPGFPAEYHYQEAPNHPSHSSKEYLGFDLQGTWANIPQHLQNQRPYQAMVPDLPFSPGQQIETAERNAVLGISSIAAGAFLLL